LERAVPDTVYRLVNRVGRGALWGLGLDVHWTGAEQVPTEGPVILAANHVSYPDFVFIQRAVLDRRRHVRFLTRHDVWDVRWLGRLLDGMRHIPVDRQAPAHAYLRARAALCAGEAVGIFPEAGISWSFTVRSLMRGVGALAGETGAPVVPVAIWGSQRVFTVGDPAPPFDWRSRGRRVDLAFGAAQQVGPDDDLTDWTARLGHTLTGLLEGLQRMPEHVPRPGEVASWYPAHLGGHALTREQAAAYDVVPRSAVRPTWGPAPAVDAPTPRSGPPPA
jgi:1-acyl-sn-glycerol-3-phosphate acyltransferase